MLVLYFSGTGNTKYIAELAAANMGAKCLSIEDETDYAAEIKAHEAIAVCYPIYGSRVPRNMREFVVAHAEALKGKKLAIFITQWIFSGDGARVILDLLPPGHIKVIYAEHFFMPNNVGNIPLIRKAKDKKIEKCMRRCEMKMQRTCENIKNGVVIKRGFSAFSRFLGKLQGKLSQGNSSNPNTSPGSLEHKARNGVRFNNDCTSCGLCARRCPVKNLEIREEKIGHNNNCVMCYRCVNLCPHKAVTVLLHRRPKWQYWLG